MSSALRVRVDAASYVAASRVLGDGVAEPLAEAGWLLVEALSTSGGMAGNDSGGVSWAEGYDRAVAGVLDAAADLIAAGFRLAGLLEQTGFNYGRAESWSVPGGVARATPDRTNWAYRSCTLPPPPSASGVSGITAPTGWSLVADAVGYVWPNGHQDRLRASASAWRSFAESVTTASYEVIRALVGIELEGAPETPDALRACRSVESQLHELASAANAVAQACDDYAGHLDDAHSTVIDELVSLLEWTAGIEVAGGLFAVVTLGGSELAAQAVEASRIAASAARIASVLSRLGELARAGACAVANVAYRAAAIADELRPLLTARIVVAVADSVEPLLIARTAAVAAEERLAVAATVRSRLAAIDDPYRFDPQSLRGLPLGELHDAMPSGWLEGPSRVGHGWVYRDPVRNGRRIRLMPGYGVGTRAEPITTGPYAVVSQNGSKVKIPLAGNPTLP